MQVGNLLLVGCGKMGAAMLAGWLGRDLAPGSVVVVEPGAPQATAAAALGVRVVDGPGDLPTDFAPEVVVLAVKPQVMDVAAPPYARFAGPGTVYLSIAAGKTIAEFERHFGGSAAIVRSMPNTPAAVGPVNTSSRYLVLWQVTMWGWASTTSFFTVIGCIEFLIPVQKRSASVPLMLK